MRAKAMAEFMASWGGDQLIKEIYLPNLYDIKFESKPKENTMIPEYLKIFLQKATLLSVQVDMNNEFDTAKYIANGTLYRVPCFINGTYIQFDDVSVNSNGGTVVLKSRNLQIEGVDLPELQRGLIRSAIAAENTKINAVQNFMGFIDNA